MNCFVIILLWQHIQCICLRCLSCREASGLASLHDKQRTKIQDMLPQQYYNEKVHIFNT